MKAWFNKALQLALPWLLSYRAWLFGNKVNALILIALTLFASSVFGASQIPCNGDPAVCARISVTVADPPPVTPPVVTPPIVVPPVTPPATWSVSQQNGRYNLMALGDSITAACCWRDVLYPALTSAGYPMEYIGSAGGHEGHGGYRAENFTKAAGTGTVGYDYFGDKRDLDKWFGPAAVTPDVLLILLGTNDRWAATPPAQILAGYDAAIAAARVKNPRVTVLVAQILPMVPADVKPLNDAIPGWASTKSTAQSRVLVVNQYTGFNTAWLRPDGVHIEAQAGHQWVADHWRTALESILLKGAAPPVVQPPIVVVPPVTPPAGGPIPAVWTPTIFRDLRVMPYTGTQPAVPASDGVGAFRNPCAPSHMLFDDPIVFPGVKGGSHLHIYFGNPSLNADSTSASLVAANASTCAGGVANLSSYWTPAVIGVDNRALVPFENLIYYKSGYNQNDPAKLVMPPNGLKMLAGHTMTTSSAQAGAPFEYRCNGVYDPNKNWQNFPPCAPGGFILVMFAYPNCGDGRLDSPDHRSHLAYSGGGKCPSTHPIAYPVISMNLKYAIGSGQDPRLWRLSSDMYDKSIAGGYSMHADLMIQWQDPISGTWMNHCVKARKDCHGFLLGDGRTTY